MSHKLQLTVLLLSLSFQICISTSRVALRLRADSQCPMPGYFRDETDCRKFYRCAEHATTVIGQHVISKVEFNCPQGTIYDETLSSCNHISFVRDIPAGCDTTNPVMGGGSNNVVDSDGSSSSMQSTPAPDPSQSNNNIPSSPGSETMPPHSSNPDNMPPPPPLAPFIPPSNLPALPIMPGGDQQNPSMPPSGIPELPVVPGEQPPLPIFPGSMPPNQGEQQPAIPFPPLPPGSQEMNPIFPAIPGFPMPGSQVPQIMPPAISVPVMEQHQQQQQQQQIRPLGYPSITIPNLPGGQKLPSTFPFNFNMFSGNFQQPSLNLQNIPGVVSLPNPNPTPGNQLQSQEVTPPAPLNQINSPTQENFQFAIAVPVENQTNEMISPGSSSSSGSTWVSPQNFLEKEQVSSSSLPNMMNNQANPSWAVPNNFPTFYTILGSRSPLVISGQQVPRQSTNAYIII